MMYPRPTAQDVLQAIARGEIKAYYQPQYDVLSNRMKSVEALARWILPDGTVLSPGYFVPVLEQTDAICQLDWHMLREVCAFLCTQPEEQRHRIAVNFSRWHFNDPEFLARLCAVVDEYGLPHRLIGVEITESAAVAHGPDVVDWVNAVKAEGFKVAMDDFGSSLSSLAFLKDVPVNVLKLDRNLLSSNCESERERVMLESIISFAHRLDMVTIAEGVETQEQLNFLRTSGCKRVQGFLMARPMPADEYARACAEHDPEGEDVLLMQSPSSATSLLMEVVFKRFPLIILANITRNSYYMMAYENFTTHESPAAGVFDDLISTGTATMHPEDQLRFRTVFDRQNLLDLHAKGEKSVRVVTRQRGDDGVYRLVETVDYFVENPSTDDVLVIAMSQTIA
ncbi:MAG: EAL domain-containing protein [Clostridia bacterium]|nr:EAL domain-containing protein [Clostridia bacterium]